MADDKPPEEEPVDAEVVPEDDAANSPPAPEAGGALVVHQGSTQLIVADSPEQLVEKATLIATTLDDVIRKKGLRTKMGDHKVVQPDGTEKWEPKYHTNIEGWQTLGTLLGVAVDVQWTRRVCGPDGAPELVRYAVTETRRKYEYPNKQKRLAQETIREYTREGFSWEARAIAVRNGAVVGTGEAMCSRSEEQWAESDDYAVRSMAQTRAMSKALKAAAGWIVALAGYSATPAEEMTGVPVERSPEDGPAYGPKLNPKAQEVVGQRLVALLGDEEAAGKAWRELLKEAGDYMPRIVAQAIVVLQTNAIPFGADDDNPDPLAGETAAPNGDGPDSLPETEKKAEEAPSGE